MRITSIESSLLAEIRYLNARRVFGDFYSDVVPVHRGYASGLPEGTSSIVVTADLQGRETFKSADGKGRVRWRKGAIHTDRNLSLKLNAAPKYSTSMRGSLSLQETNFSKIELNQAGPTCASSRGGIIQHESCFSNPMCG